MAETQSAWQCSQCGTVNEPGVRACSGCGKWPSLFDLQNTVEDAPMEADDALEPMPELFDPEMFEPETFEAEPFEPESYRRRSFEAPPTVDVGEPPDGDDDERKSRFPRWVVTAIWVLGALVWLGVKVLGGSS